MHTPISTGVTTSVLLISEPRIRKRVSAWMYKTQGIKIYALSTFYPTCESIISGLQDIYENNQISKVYAFYELDYLEFPCSNKNVNPDDFIYYIKNKYLTSEIYLYKKGNIKAEYIQECSNDHHKVYYFDMAKGEFDKETGIPLR